MGEVHLLRPLEIFQAFLGVSWNAGSHAGKGGLLQIAVGSPVRQPADFSPLRVGGVPGDAQLPQSQGVDSSHVTRGVGDHGGAVGQKGVQLRRRGVAAFRQVILVVSKADHPLSGGNGPLFSKGLHPPADFLQAFTACQLAQPQGLGQGGDVAVTVHKGGEKSAALQVDGAGAFGKGLHLRALSQSQDFPVFHQQGLNRLPSLQRQNGAAKIQGFHRHSSHGWIFSQFSSVWHIYPPKARSIPHLA